MPPSGLPWKEFRLLTFDCYGTLVDWEAGILAVLQHWALTHDVEATEDALLAAFGCAESVTQSDRPQALYRDILRGSMARIATSFGKSADPGEREKLATSVQDWPVFPDTVDSLRALKSWHKLMVVSNVDKASFAGTAPKLGVDLDGLVTAEAVGAYKPDQKMFESALAVAREWGISHTQILHVAQSLYHDVVPAKSMGLRTVWVDRRGGKSGGATPPASGDATPHIRVSSLEELVRIERLERGA